MRKRLAAALLSLTLIASANAEDLLQKGLEAYNKQDYAAAIEIWRPLAESGNASAQFALGAMYANGEGMPKDSGQAVTWYRKAAEQGYAGAQFNLGVMYENGQGVAQDAAQAVAWYRKAAEQGYADAQFNLGVMYANGQGIPKDEAQAAAWFRKAAEQGNASAQYSLGNKYQNGQGVPKDEAQAAAWYRKAAEQGHARAQLILGAKYSIGEGVPEDNAQAATWFGKAAEQGNADAQHLLGSMYAAGIGVKQNYAWAVYWEAFSAQQGNEAAINSLITYRDQLTKYRAKSTTLNVRAKPTTDSKVLRQAQQGDILYRLDEPANGWIEVYLPDGHTIGYVSESLVAKLQNGGSRVASNSSPYPAPPAARPGYTTCNTKCFNGNCFRTYSDGRQVNFQAQQRWNPMNNRFEWDSGSC